mgnify:CR=1 FL=1
MKWEKVKLGDICKSIADGDHQAPKKQESGIPFITISNIDSNNRIDFTNCLYVSEEYYDAINDKRKASKDDILYSVVGSFGVPVLIKENLKFAFQRHIAILRPDTEKIFPAFMYYCILARDFYLQADSVAIGSAQRTITLGALNNMQLSLPPLPVQQRIASILSAYDDLIENNQKQINLLEEAAQRLYKEWFVDLRFPGHENVKIVDGVPEGWKIKKIEELADTMSGGTPTRSHEEYYSSGEILWLKTKELNDGFIFDTEEKITEAGLKNSSAKLFEKGCIILAMYGATIGRLGISSVTMCCNQACCVLKIKEKILFEYVYLWLVNNREMLISRGRGSAQSNLSQELIKQIEVRIPSDGVLIKFSNVVDKLLKNKEILEKQISFLREARDRLLPKLMSGEIEA